MKSPTPELYLTHILESISMARSYVAGIDLVEFSQDWQLQGRPRQVYRMMRNAQAIAPRFAILDG